MRTFFPLLALALAAIIPACTCSSGSDTPTADHPAEAPSAASLRVHSAHRLMNPNLRVPTGRMQINSAGLRMLRTAPGVVPHASASASASTPTH